MPKKTEERQYADSIIHDAVKSWGVGWSRLSEEQKQAEVARIFVSRIINLSGNSTSDPVFQFVREVAHELWNSFSGEVNT